MTRLSKSDTRDLLRDTARSLDVPTRRAFIRNVVGLGSLSLLTGCNIVDEDKAEGVLRYVSEFNDRVQAWLFRPHVLAPEYTVAEITRPFPFNAFYGPADAPYVDGSAYRLEVAGKVENRKSWTLPELGQLPQFTQITRHVCVEGWSAIGSWTGVRFSDFLQRVGADTTAPYVNFRCADGYFESIDMPTALHPQTQITLRYADETLPRIYGFPMKLRIPTKLGFKNPKHILSMEVSDTSIGGYWSNQGYNWFSGL